jgi:hypothetical protein
VSTDRIVTTRLSAALADEVIVPTFSAGAG